MGLLAYLSIVGIPCGKACLMIGKEAVDRRTVNQKADIGTGIFGSIGNLFWFILAGIWLAIGIYSLS